MVNGYEWENAWQWMVVGELIANWRLDIKLRILE